MARQTYIDMSKLNARYRQMPLQGLGSGMFGEDSLGTGPVRRAGNYTFVGAPRQAGVGAYLKQGGCVPMGAVAPGSLPYCNGTANPLIKTFQTNINKILARLGYQPIAVDGQLGPATCGAFSMLGDEKNAGRVTDAEWKSLPLDVIVGSAGSCESYTLPTRVGATKPDTPSTVLTPDTYALPWGVATPSAAQVQKDINKDLDAHNYYGVQESGKLDAATCGAFRLLETQYGLNYLYTYGKNCQSYQDPQKKPQGQGYQDPKDPQKAGLLALGLVGGAIAIVAVVAYNQKRKKKYRKNRRRR